MTPTRAQLDAAEARLLNEWRPLVTISRDRWLGMRCGDQHTRYLLSCVRADMANRREPLATTIDRRPLDIVSRRRIIMMSTG